MSVPDPSAQAARRRAVQGVLNDIELLGMLSVFELRAELKSGEPIIVCWWTPWDPETKTDRKFRTCARAVGGRKEIVRTAYELLEATLIHELGELFSVGGERPFYPHDVTDPLTNDPFLLDRS